MFDKLGIDRLHDPRHEVAEGYLSVGDHKEFLFQPFYCRVMVKSVDLRLV
jgi:hypothetical protein